MKLSGKIAIVTGATGGIGFEVAQHLGKHGCTVILNGIDDEKGAERLATLTEQGVTAAYYGFDVTDEHAVNEHIKAIGDKYGKIDIVINNVLSIGYGA